MSDDDVLNVLYCQMKLAQTSSHTVRLELWEVALFVWLVIQPCLSARVIFFSNCKLLLLTVHNFE